MKIVIAVILIIALLVIGTLLKNRAPLFDPPGLKKRLAVYLTTNSAKTSDDHPFAELRTPVFDAGPDVLYIAVKDAANDLGWAIIDSDDVKWRIDMSAKSDILLFVDDVRVEIEPLVCKEGVTKTALHVHSQSRIGSADFAANADHVQQLVKAVNNRLELGFIH
jgi:uncharacterized protein (DUF1499 family)